MRECYFMVGCVLMIVGLRIIPWLAGSAFVMSIIKNGFDERHAYIGGMFGAGITILYSTKL